MLAVFDATMEGLDKVMATDVAVGGEVMVSVVVDENIGTKVFLATAIV